VMTSIVPKEHQALAIKLREVLAHYAKNELLIKIGEYKRGSDKMGDFAIDNIDKVNKFLKQAVDEKCSFQETLQLLRAIFK
jgi:type III secretion protein N (ATPase)